MATDVICASAPRRSRVSYGAALTFETLVGSDAPIRRRPDEDVLLRVIAGVVELRVEDESCVLETGDEAIVPAGARHRLSAISADARVVSGLRSR